MFRSIVLLAGGLASLVAVSSPAQEVILGQKYGRGVHDYFSGEYTKAYDQLTAAIDAGSKDPRAFYFRGLTYLKLGRSLESVQDFKKGAELESKDVNKFYNVSKALERVQGQPRIELENYRVEARMAALEDAERLRKLRYEAIQREESRVLREQPPAPAEDIKAPVEPAAAAEKPAEPAAAAEKQAEPAADDPFAAPEEKPAEKKAEKKAAVEPAADEAGDKAAAPAGDDPFGAPADKPAKKAAAKVEKEEEPAAKGDAADPFATDEKPAKKTGKKAAKVEKEEEPAAKEEEPAAKGDAADPFATDEKPAKKTGKKAAKKEKEEKPAADDKADEKGNPFMEESDAAEKESGAKKKPADDEKEAAADEKPAADEEPAADEKPAKSKKSADKKSTEKKAAGKKAAKKGDNEDPFAQ